MLSPLASKRSPLVIAVVRDVTEQKQVNETLRRLSIRLLKAQDAERRRIARELHDSTGQNLAAVAMNLSLVTRSAGVLDTLAQKALAESIAMVEGCVREIRTLSYLLHPPMLDEIGFGPAASWFVEGYSKRTGIDVSCHIAPEAEHLPRHLELTLFRILQEALTNIHRHSKSMWAEVSVSVTAGEVMLRVKDYGNGISPEVLAKFTLNGTHAGVGLSGMKERVRELHGEFKIVSDSKGTQIAVKMPLKIEGQLSPTAAG